MMNFTLILAFLFTLSWITKSNFEFSSVVVQAGEDVTLLCSNLSSFSGHIFWFKLSNGSISRISSIYIPESKARLYDGFQHDRFNMTSNGTNIFLNIKQVNFSDSGVYICGLNSDKCGRIFSETYLQVKGVTRPKWGSEPKSKEAGLDGFNQLLTVTLGSIVIFLVAVIMGLVWKIRTFHTAQTNIKNQQDNENLDSNTPDYAALKFRPKANSNRMPSAEREMETHVLYAATR